jgi:ergothioneine biosynthesis protein EgtB
MLGALLEDRVLSVIAAEQGSTWCEGYTEVRGRSVDLCRPLALEDFGVQPMDDASPPKWHLAHTSWFFESFILKPFKNGYVPFDPAFEYLFNSYYNGVGQQFPRPKRGHLSRPTVDEVLTYREHVDCAMNELLVDGDPEVERRTIMGLNHEQQHQELILTDLKYNLGHNPLRPAYRHDLRAPDATDVALRYVDVPGAEVSIGREAQAPGFAFDNETPSHTVLLGAFQIANRLVTNGEYLEFMEDDGYERPELWLSDGWTALQTGQLRRNPCYWFRSDGGWCEYALAGAAPLLMRCPVTHVSFYEADAYARWAQARLLTEGEWEHVAAMAADPNNGNFVESNYLQPIPCPDDGVGASGIASGILQLYGDAWEWTTSGYAPYPGFRPLPGTLGEYNGKFMCNQLVLRGGSCATPRGHVRPTYRNFFYPGDQWQFSGIRLAR